MAQAQRDHRGHAARNKPEPAHPHRSRRPFFRPAAGAGPGVVLLVTAGGREGPGPDMVNLPEERRHQPTTCCGSTARPAAISTTCAVADGPGWWPTVIHEPIGSRRQRHRRGADPGRLEEVLQHDAHPWPPAQAPVHPEIEEAGFGMAAPTARRWETARRSACRLPDAWSSPWIPRTGGELLTDGACAGMDFNRARLAIVSE